MALAQPMVSHDHGGPDLDLLRAGAAGPVQGLYGPHSMTWVLARELALGFGGGAALLMQLAHPLVAAGVAAHSDFRTDPLGRNLRTFASIYTIFFGDLQTALDVVRRVHHRHCAVTGHVAPGEQQAGAPYRATQPDLLLWVHATLVDTALRTYPLLVRPLSRTEAERFYAESHLTAAAFGIPRPLVPPTLGDFEDYMARMLAGDTLAVGPVARGLWRELTALPPTHVLAGMRTALGGRTRPPHRRGRLGGALEAGPLRGALDRLAALATAGLLPQRLRRDFGYSWSPGDARLWSGAVAVLRRVVPLLPPALRHVPAYRQALARLRS